MPLLLQALWLLFCICGFLYIFFSSSRDSRPKPWLLTLAPRRVGVARERCLLYRFTLIFSFGSERTVTSRSQIKIISRALIIGCCWMLAGYERIVGGIINFDCQPISFFFAAYKEVKSMRFAQGIVRQINVSLSKCSEIFRCGSFREAARAVNLGRLVRACGILFYSKVIS